MTLKVYNNGRAWNFFAAVFKIGSSKFQRMIKKYVETVRPEAFQQLANKRKSNLRWNTYRKQKWCSNSTLTLDTPLMLYSNSPSSQLKEWKISRLNSAESILCIDLMSKFLYYLLVWLSTRQVIF